MASDPTLCCLQPLESAGFDVAEFKLDPADVKQRVHVSNYITREKSYSAEIRREDAFHDKTRCSDRLLRRDPQRLKNLATATKC